MNNIIWIVLIGLATGLLARTLLRGGRFGVIGDTSVGILGAVLGVLLFRLALDDTGGVWGFTALAAGGAALLILDLRLIQKSFEAGRMPLAFWRRCSPVLKRAPLVPRPPDAALETCRVCGQKHLIERSRA